ncbi:MAG: PocR ligand-binding domain-containing protein [Abditibacteriales bacterium]|nr:PocR ligand-binding domain-containing protein [Abditibacteriales bacterium]MDW8366916.1 PocR ligand-binding domain-containing protein [Abditibacteriales bacterium]
MPRLPSASSLDAAALRALLRVFSDVTGLNVVALNTEGAPLWDGDELFACPQCRARRGVSSCRRRTQEAARTAAAAGVTHVYVCQEDIAGVAVPLFGASGVIACFCAGPVLMRPPSRGETERRATRRIETDANRPTLPVLSEEQMNACAQLLAGVGQFALHGGRAGGDARPYGCPPTGRDGKLGAVRTLPLRRRG